MKAHAVSVSRRLVRLDARQAAHAVPMEDVSRMMCLSTMWKVDSTIDANGSSPVAEQILDRWTCDSGSIRFFRSSANFVYVFRSEGKHHFLRFADSLE